MRIVRRLIIVSSLVSTLFSINSIAGLELLPCLPLLFLLITCICIPKYVVMGTGMMMLLLVLSIRYIVYPPLLCQDCFISETDLTYAPQAILLMLFEIIFNSSLSSLFTSRHLLTAFFWFKDMIKYFFFWSNLLNRSLSH